LLKQRSSDGISLRTIHLWLMIGAALMAALMMYTTFQLSTNFSHIAEASEQQIELRKAARELMDASDYLTESVQRFTIHGDRRFMDDYFTEAFENNRREEAISTMSAGTGAESALSSLQLAMNGSLELMNREYYAMRLVIDAKGYTDYPEALRSVVLSEEDLALSPDEKLFRAIDMVHDDAYYSQKNSIRANMRASLDALEQMAYDDDSAMLDSFSRDLALVRVVIILQTIGIFFMVWLTAHLGIHPVLTAVQRIKEDNPIPEVGANEFRYLARTYNKMYEVYKTSLDHLNFKASHDELTGAYNRSGYDLLLSSLDLATTYMLLFDVDNFKSINDTYGHETGDKVLVKLVQILTSNFRSDDYVCRIGGDEFVVFMVHAVKTQNELVASIVRTILEKLAETSDGLPKTSVSVGIAHGSDAAESKNLFSLADKAMYLAKQSGKSGHAFYKK